MTDIRPILDVASRDLFIKGMRQVASSVAVVTTVGKAGRHGATVSAFSSVSADPPQLLVCLRSASRIAAAVSANGVFCLNILSYRHQNVAERFSGRHDTTLSDRFEGIDLSHEEEEDWVLLKGANAFACSISDRLVSGTHTIYLGNVLRIQISSDDPLTYLQGRYRQIGQ